MIIDRAMAADLPAIAALDADAFGAGAWSDATWAAELASPRAYVVVARDPDGAVLGAATFSLAGDVADLDRVVVAPGRRGRGLGRCLVRAGLEWADVVGADRMLLEVEAGNAPALALYRRVGFAEIAVRRGYYGPDRDAVVMRRPVAEEFVEVSCA